MSFHLDSNCTIKQATKKTLSSSLVKWYRNAARDLPWRHTTDPYYIWVSEVILQQTTVAQGEAYYHRFLKLFPDIAALASAPLDDVLKAWEGLGYYSRARNLHAAANDVMKRFSGIFPSNYDDILSLKGIGPYAAAAIGSFVYGLPYVVVDGNVLRVISRLFGMTDSIDETKTKKTIKALAQELQDMADPAEFNQTIMEFGALVCTYKNPGCDSCPIQEHCLAFKKDQVPHLPVRTKKIKKRHRAFHFYIIEDKKGQVIIEQRHDKDVWQGLFQFPMIEVKDIHHETTLHDATDIVFKTKTYESSDMYKQTLTHQKITAQFFHHKLSSPFTRAQKSGRKIVDMTELDALAWPKIISNYLKDKGLA